MHRQTSVKASPGLKNDYKPKCNVLHCAAAAANMFQASNYYLYSSATQDGSGFYVAGTSSNSCDDLASVRYIPFGGSVSFPVNDTMGRCNYDARYATIYDGQLFAVFSDPGKRGVYKMGDGLPTSPNQMASLLPGFGMPETQATLGTAAGYNQLGALLWESPSVFYLADASNTTIRHVFRYMKNQETGMWVFSRSIKFNTTDIMWSLTGRQEQNPATGELQFILYGLSMSGAATATQGDGRIWRYNTAEGTGLGAPFAMNPTVNTRWRSIMLPPLDLGMFQASSSGTPTVSPSQT